MSSSEAPRKDSGHDLESGENDHSALRSTNLREWDVKSRVDSQPSLQEQLEHKEGDTPEKQSIESAKDTAKDDLYASGLGLVVILVAAALSVFLVALDTNIISTAIPKITDDFKRVDDIGWYGSGFFLPFGALQLAWGTAYRYWKVKTVYLVAITVFEIGSLVCALASNSTALIIGRAVAGSGGGGIAGGSFLIVALTAPPARVPALQGLLAASFTVASAVGPLIGGVFTSQVSWRWCFYINLPIGGLAVALVVFFFSNPRHHKPVVASLKKKLLDLDPLGLTILLTSAMCFYLAMQWGEATKPWNSGPVIGTLVASAILFILYIVFEALGGKHVGIPRKLLKLKTIRFQLMAQGFIFGAFFTLLYYLPIYFQAVSGFSPEASGVRSIPLVGGASVFAIISGLIISLTGEFQPQMIVGHSVTCISCGLIFTLGLGSSVGEWAGYEVLAGVGAGLALQMAVIVCQQIVDSEDLAHASSLALFVQFMVGATCLSIAQSIFQNELLQALAHNIPDMQPSVIVAAGATGLRSVLSPEQLLLGVEGYLTGIKKAFVFATSLAGMGAVVSISSLIFDRRKIEKKNAGAINAA